MKWSASLLVAFSLAAPAMADVNIAGQWTFNADVPNECSFGGSAHLEKVSDDGFDIPPLLAPGQEPDSVLEAFEGFGPDAQMPRKALRRPQESRNSFKPLQIPRSF